METFLINTVKWEELNKYILMHTGRIASSLANWCCSSMIFFLWQTSYDGPKIGKFAALPEPAKVKYKF